MRARYDIIIAGAGPAGLTAAMTAATEGFSVLLVDTKENITRHTRPCCSMWLLEPGFHNEGWTFSDGKIFFHRNDFFIPYSGGIIDLFRSVRISSQGHSLVMGKKLSPIAKVIDKHQLLKGLFNNVEKLKVEIRPKTTCLYIEENEKGIRAKLRHKGSEEWVRGNYFLAADGVDSRVVHSMGLNKTRKMLIRTSVLNYYFADVQTPYPDAWVQLIGNGFNGVSGTLLRKPDCNDAENIYEIGVIPPAGKNIGFKDGMDRLLSHPLLKTWLSEARLIQKKGCRWTCWTPIATPARGRVIILGDAAAFQEVENQGAIMCGFNAAKAVSAMERGQDGCTTYNQFWQESFEFNDKDILNNTWKGFVFKFLGEEHIDYILSLAQGQFLDGYVNHFKSGTLMFDFIKSQLPKIERERPDLAKKVRQFEEFNIEENVIGKVNN